jgi:hypothetical protein
MTKEPETVELIFEEPPDDGRGHRPGKTPVGQWLASLREHPGQWAKFPKEQMSGSAAGVIRRGQGYGVKKGEFEAASRSTTNKRFWLYARYVGAPAAAVTEDGES